MNEVTDVRRDFEKMSYGRQTKSVQMSCTLYTLIFRRKPMHYAYTKREKSKITKEPVRTSQFSVVLQTIIDINQLVRIKF